MLLSVGEPSSWPSWLELSPCMGGGEVEASFPARCHEEFLSGVIDHGPSWGRCLAANQAHEDGAFITPPRGEDQAAKVVSDELKVSEVNDFTKGESTAHQMLAIGGNDYCRRENQQNIYKKARCKSSFLVCQLSMFFHGQDIGWSRSRILVLRWSCEL
jgi:hypothetical protein